MASFAVEAAMNPVLARVTRLLDRFTLHITGVARWLLVPALSAWSVGATLWAVAHPARLGDMFRNQLTHEERLEALAFLGVAAVGVGLIYGAVLRVRPELRAERIRLERLLLFTIAGPFVAALATPGIERDHPLLTCLYIACAVGACSLLLWELAPAGGRVAPLARHRRGWLRENGLADRWAPASILLLLAAGYSWFFSSLAIANHHAFNTRTTDLGLYDNIFFQTIHGNPLGCSFIKGSYHGSAHFDPILVLLSPLYLVYPRAESLLVLQSLWCAAGVVPAYLIGKHFLRKRWAGLVMALVYLFYPAVHGANLYEFHSLTLLGMPLLWALYFLGKGDTRKFVWTLPILLLVREDVALLMSVVGGAALFMGERKFVRAGWVTIGISLSYFLVVKQFFMVSPELLNTGEGSYSFAYYYRDLIPNQRSAADLALSVLTNPVHSLTVMLREQKLLYILQLFLPLLFLPLVARRGRLMMSYGLLFTLLASRRAVFSLYFQYTALLFPVLLVLAACGLRRLEKIYGPRSRELTTVVGCLLLSSLLVSWKFGAIVQNDAFEAGFRPLVRALDREQSAHYRLVSDRIQEIDPKASVAVTDRVGAHASNRAEVYFYRERSDTDFVIVDERDLSGRRREAYLQSIADGRLVEIGTFRTIHFFEVAEPSVRSP